MGLVNTFFCLFVWFFSVCFPTCTFSTLLVFLAPKSRISNGLSLNLLRQNITNGTVCSRRGLAPFVFQLVQPSMSEWAKYYTFNKLFHVMCYALPYLSRVDTLYGNLIQKIDVLFMTWFSNNLSVFFFQAKQISRCCWCWSQWGVIIF